jgi:site-specific recombinase XerD
MLHVWQPSPLSTSLFAFLLDRQAARCPPKTLEHYEYTCGGFVKWLGVQGILDVGQITAHHIRAYLVSLQQRGLKDTTQYAHARGIKAWLNWLVREGDLDESPMRKVAIPKLEERIPAPFKASDVKRLLAHCNRKTPIGARNYSIVLTLLDTGLRAAEFVSLRVGGPDMRSGLATIVGKGRKQRPG